MFNDVRILKMQKLASIGSLVSMPICILYVLKRKKKKENFVYTL